METRDFGRIIGYEFKNEEYLERALTHSSHARCVKGRTKNNERLEFLGDAFFDAIISDELYERMKGVGEGTLTKVRAKIVCERSLAERALSLGIGEYILMSKGEERSGGRTKTSIVADALEAVIGAVYKDGGYDAAKAVVVRIFSQTIDDAVSGKLLTDYKTEIQERVQAGSKGTLKYVVTREEGPDHDKVFYVDLYCRDRVIGSGNGKTKKEAEHNAAKAAVEKDVG